MRGGSGVFMLGKSGKAFAKVFSGGLSFKNLPISGGGIDIPKAGFREIGRDQDGVFFIHVREIRERERPRRQSKQAR
jgi:hypothetical protein